MAESSRIRHAQRTTDRRTRGSRCGAVSTVGAASVLAVMLATGGGVWWWVKNRDTSTGPAVLLHTVERADFELTVTERGEIEAYDVTEVRSLVKAATGSTGYAILRIVPEGTVVQKGDFLVELDSSALQAQRTTQMIAVNAAKAAEVEAKNLHEVAVIAKREYLDGTYLQERQTIESEVFVAEENLNRAREYYLYSQKLAAKGYVNDLQLEADRFAVEKAKKDLGAAKTKLKVLDEFTKAKMLSTLESDILTTEAKWEAAKNSYELELEKLAELDDQIAKCTITAPQDGVVKYAHETDRRGDTEFIVEEGTIVRERQSIIRLPNADSMRVNLTVNESLIQYVRPGLPAAIRPVGFGDRVLTGYVEKVNQYAEPSGWRQANVKEYKAFVAIDYPPPDLRSGMTASVTIQCANVPDALQVPVQSVYAHGDKFFCFAYDGGRWEAREVKAGPTNDKFFVIESGLNEGAQVAMNPRAYLEYVSLPKLSPAEAQRAVPQFSVPRREEDVAQREGEEGREPAQPKADADPDAGQVRRGSQVGRRSPDPAQRQTEGLQSGSTGRPALGPVARSEDRPQRATASGGAAE